MERDAGGRFVEGHRGMGGRKKRETEQRLLDILRGCVTDEDASAIIQRAVRDARDKGDAVARKWLFDYLVGLPVQRIAPTDPTGENEYLGLGDAELITGLTRLLDAARAREAETADAGSAEPVVDPGQAEPTPASG